MWPSRSRGTALPSARSSPRRRGTWGRGTQGRGRTHCDRGSECSPGPGHAGWAARKGFTSPMPMSPNSVTDKATWAGATTSSASPFTSTRLAMRGSSSGRAPGRAKSTASLGLLPGSGGAVAGGHKAGSTRPGGPPGQGHGWGRIQLLERTRPRIRGRKAVGTLPRLTDAAGHTVHAEQLCEENTAEAGPPAHPRQLPGDPAVPTEVCPAKITLVPSGCHRHRAPTRPPQSGPACGPSARRCPHQASHTRRRNPSYRCRAPRLTAPDWGGIVTRTQQVQRNSNKPNRGRQA